MAKLKLRLVVVNEDDAAPGKTAKAFSRQLRITALTLLLSLALLIAVTVAWFALNKKVQNTGMQVDVQTTPNLIIANKATYDPTVSSDAAFKALDATATTASFASNTATKLVPATHDSLLYADSGTGLKYNPNPDRISSSSGLVKSGSSLSLTAVTSNSDPYYYLDYTARVASADSELDLAPEDGDTAHLYARFRDDSGNISITSITSRDPSTGEISASQSMTPAAYASAVTGKQRDQVYAASIDFFFLGTNPSAACDATTYAGTLNIAEKLYSDSTTANTEVDLLGATSANGTTPGTITTIPCNSAASNNCYYVTMRVYFDGALLKQAGTAYVRSAELSTQEFALNVYFSAETESSGG